MYKSHNTYVISQEVGQNLRYFCGYGRITGKSGLGAVRVVTRRINNRHRAVSANLQELETGNVHPCTFMITVYPEAPTLLAVRLHQTKEYLTGKDWPRFGSALSCRTGIHRVYASSVARIINHSTQ